MKKKNQLIKEMKTLVSHIEPLTDLSVGLLQDSRKDNPLIKRTIAQTLMQDTLYTEYYFPKAKKGVNIIEHNKRKTEEEIEDIANRYSFNDLVTLLIEKRKTLIKVIESVEECKLHSFFSINNVNFTIYDHIEHILYNDSLVLDKISTNVT